MGVRTGEFTAKLRVVAAGLGLVLVAGGSGVAQTKAQDRDWPANNGGRDGDHYSELTQINRGNVAGLKQAWVFDTGEKGGLQANPLVVGRVLYTVTPTQKVVALDAATGKLK